MTAAMVAFRMSETRPVVDSLTSIDWPKLRARHVGNPVVSQLVAGAMRALADCIDVGQVSDRTFERMLAEPASVTVADVAGYRELAAEDARAFDVLKPAVLALHETLCRL